MKRIAGIISAATLAVGLASPAMAQSFSFGGYYRLTGVTQNIKSKATDPVGETLIDQRIRMKFTDTLNDYVKFVYFAEVDTPWGQQSKGKIGGGGEAGADGVNVETKHAYLDLKLPETTIKARLGLQGIDDLFEYVVISEDVAAASVAATIAGVDAEAIYSKFKEGTTTAWDDQDFYAFHLTKKFNDSLKAGGAVYYLDDNSNNGVGDAETFWYGLLGDYKFSNFNLNGFVIVQDGTKETAAGEIDSQALAASVRGAMVLPGGHGQVGLRAIYFSPDDDAKDDNAWKSGVGEWEFPRENMMIFLPDRWINNTGTTRYAITDASTAGFGLYALTASAFLKNLPLHTYANLGAGAFWAADSRNDAGGSHVGGTQVTAASDLRAGSTLGYEVTAEVGKTIAEKVDVSLRGAYALLGDFYDDTVKDAAGTVGSPDNLFKVAMMVTVNF